MSPGKPRRVWIPLRPLRATHKSTHNWDSTREDLSGLPPNPTPNQNRRPLIATIRTFVSSENKPKITGKITSQTALIPRM